MIEFSDFFCWKIFWRQKIFQQKKSENSIKMDDYAPCLYRIASHFHFAKNARDWAENTKFSSHNFLEIQTTENMG